MEAIQPTDISYTPRVLLALVVGFVAGICVGEWREGNYADVWWSASVAGGAFLLWIVFLRRWWVLVVVALFFGGACGVARLAVTHHAFEAEIAALAVYVGEEVTLEGVVVVEPDERAAHTNLTVRVDVLYAENESVVAGDAQTLEGTVLLRTERFPEFRYGDRVRASGRLDIPEAFETDLGRTFDYRGYLRARDVTHTLSFARASLVAHDEGNPLIARLLTLKHIFMDGIEAALPEPSAGLAEGVTLGVKRALGEDLEAAFRRTGIIHIVVLSGYNVSVVAEAVMRLLTRFFKPRVRVIAGILAIATFAIVVGLSATVVRASLMASLILYARATGKTGNALRALVFAGMIMLLINPLLLLHDPGFQLSFLATAGLILLSPLVEKRLSLVPTKLQLREFATATIATQIFILPFLLFLIGEFSVVSVLVNVLVLPAVPLSMLGTLFVGVLGAIHVGLALVVAFPTYLLLMYIIKVAEWFGALPFAAFDVPAFSFTAVIAAYAAITAFLYYVHRTNPQTQERITPQMQ